MTKTANPGRHQNECGEEEQRDLIQFTEPVGAIQVSATQHHHFTGGQDGADEDIHGCRLLNIISKQSETSM